MTNEELITGLRHIAHTMERNGHSYYQHIAENAIKALEQQPCEDCISRQQALDCFEQTNTRQGAKYAIETLPSVTPQRPKGKWIETPVENDIVPVVFKCSECGMRVINPYKYCPNCGAEMSGGEEK